MTAIFALLREDHIIFASDSRHVRGDAYGRYKNDQAWKVQLILGNRGLLGFAGDDRVEEVMALAKRNSILSGTSIRDVAEGITDIVQMLYGKYIFQDQLRMQFLLTGFDQENGREVAKLATVSGRIPKYCSYQPECDNYEIIGYPCHGAFYIMRKCAKECTSVEAGIRLACFTLVEIGKYETRVGGNPQVYVIRRGKEVTNMSQELQEHIDWAASVGEEIRQLIVSPAKPQTSQ
jgi:20S proteasome alpha/beta subunit